MSEICKHPTTRDLAVTAYKASGCATHKAFCDLFGGAIGLRTFRAWLKGERPAEPVAALVLREFVAGWRPSCLS